MATVCSTESIVYVNVCVTCKSFRELFLACFHCFLSFVVSRVFFVNANRFAFFFRIETEVFKEKNFTRFEGCGSISSFSTVRSEFHVNTESGSNCVLDL